MTNRNMDSFILLLLALATACAPAFPVSARDSAEYEQQPYDTGVALDDWDGDGVVDNEDCARTDVNAWEWALPDNDGDGYPNPGINIIECISTPLPPFYVLADSRLETDCNDADPALFHWTCVDADGDNFCETMDETTFYCDGSDVADGYSIVSDADSAPDCDDSDPQLAKAFYLDNDGDGDYSRQPSGCIGIDGGFPEDAERVAGGDCDDADPLFSVNRPDMLLDGIDHNCDGLDEYGIGGCVQDPSLCWFLGEALDSSCGSGVDIEVFGMESRRLAAVNVGGQTYNGGLSIEFVDTFPVSATVFQVKMAPGDYRVFDHGWIGRIRIEPVDMVDCDTDNNEIDVYPVLVPE